MMNVPGRSAGAADRSDTNRADAGATLKDGDPAAPSRTSVPKKTNATAIAHATARARGKRRSNHPTTIPIAADAQTREDVR